MTEALVCRERAAFLHPCQVVWDFPALLGTSLGGVAVMVQEAWWGRGEHSKQDSVLQAVPKSHSIQIPSILVAGGWRPHPCRVAGASPGEVESWAALGQLQWDQSKANEEVL